jgi:hypothetical protein
VGVLTNSIDCIISSGSDSRSDDDISFSSCVLFNLRFFFFGGDVHDESITDRLHEALFDIEFNINPVGVVTKSFEIADEDNDILFGSPEEIDAIVVANY